MNVLKSFGRSSTAVLVGVLFMAAASVCMAETLVVTNTSDDTGVGNCAAPDATPNCSLRQAITVANASPGATTIQFNIQAAPVNGKHAIVPTSNATATTIFPIVTQPLSIDGESQSGWASGNLVIELLNSNNLPGVLLRLSSNNNTVKGVLFDGFAGIVSVPSAAVVSSGNQIVRNEFTKHDSRPGNAIIFNGNNNIASYNYFHDFPPNISYRGVIVQNGHQNLVSNNRFVNILGNTSSSSAIRIGPSSRENVIEDNYIENTVLWGIEVLDGNFVADPNNPRPSIIRRNTIISTGSHVGEGTAIIPFATSYNQFYENIIMDQLTGIDLHRVASNNLFKNNLISGTQASVNSQGISVINQSNQNIFEGNVVTNRELGIGIKSDSNNNEFKNNYIGVDKDGVPGGNTKAGVLIGPDLCKTICFYTIGPTGNLLFNNKIAYNGTGVLVGSGGYPVKNFVIEIANDAYNNSILSNSIYQNVNLGIDLSKDYSVIQDPDDPDYDISTTLPDGVTANDYLDIDLFANHFQNYPELIWAKIWQGLVRVHGQLYSESYKRYKIEFFANKPSKVDGSGYGEGQCFLGSYEVDTNAEGHSVLDTKNQFEAAFKTGQCSVMLGDYVTATATEMLPDGLGGYKSGSTSEFSQAILVNQ